MLFRPNRSANRRSPRQWWNSSVHLATSTGSIKAIGVNISAGGMGLFAVANLPVGSPVEVEFLAPGQGHFLRRSAVVRHRALYLYGLEFLSSEFKPLVRESAAAQPSV